MAAGLRTPEARAAAEDRADSCEVRRFLEPRRLLASGPPAVLGKHGRTPEEDAAAPHPAVEAPHHLREGFRSDDLIRPWKLLTTFAKDFDLTTSFAATFKAAARGDH